MCVSVSSGGWWQILGHSGLWQSLLSQHLAPLCSQGGSFFSDSIILRFCYAASLSICTIPVWVWSHLHSGGSGVCFPSECHLSVSAALTAALEPSRFLCTHYEIGCKFAMLASVSHIDWSHDFVACPGYCWLAGYPSLGFLPISFLSSLAPEIEELGLQIRSSSCQREKAREEDRGLRV